jgi:DnaJ-domain-containing protein 1
MSWLDFAFGLASRATKKAATRLRAEYVSGREGSPGPAKTGAPAGRMPPEQRTAGPVWWEVLRVSRGASLQEVGAAYRELIQKNHPDKVAHLSEQIRGVADRETRRINAAYAEARRVLGGGGSGR